MYSTYIGLNNHHVIKKFILGYGLTFSQNAWRRQETDYGYGYETEDEWFQERRYFEKKKISHNLGCNFSIYYNCYKYFNVGIVCRRDFYQFGNNHKFIYQYTFSLDLAWKIRLKTAKSK